MGQAAAGAAREPSPDTELAPLRATHGTAWAIGIEDGRWRAARRDGTGPVLTRASAAGLDFALRISTGRRPW
jgi:hypothetical protein